MGRQRNSIIVLSSYLAVFHSITFITSALDPSQALVKTELGRIQGSVMESTAGRPFMAFRGIPYAKPPVGELRFQEPVPVEPWQGIFNGTLEAPVCIQYGYYESSVLGTEDCLRLNVYSHDIHRVSLLPVMLWIHGGSWYSGSGNGETYYFGPHHLMDRDIILVTINYRLGPFGFLSTEDETAPGNYGLLDQVMALKWVQKYIHHFGGDPHSVTIIGESVGGCSVHFHVLSPRSTGLFHKAIALSGVGLSPWATVKSASTYAKMLAEYVHCPLQPPSSLISCLKQAPAVNLTSFREKIQKLDMWAIGFGPRVDSERISPMLPKNPAVLIRDGKINQVPLIIGVNKNETAWVIAEMLSKGGQGLDNFAESPEKFLPSMLGMEFDSDRDAKSAKVLQQYFPNRTHLKKELGQLEMMITDATFFKAFNTSADLHAAGNPVYLYWYTYKGSFSWPNLYGIPNTTDLGVCHGDELALIFTGPKYFPPISNPRDKVVSGHLLDLFVSFATNGTPNAKENTTWLPATKNKMQYLQIHYQLQLVQGYFPFSDRMPFWDKIYSSSSNSWKPIFPILFLGVVLSCILSF